jgi:hypothetical protein
MRSWIVLFLCVGCSSSSPSGAQDAGTDVAVLDDAPAADTHVGATDGGTKPTDATPEIAPGLCNDLVLDGPDPIESTAPPPPPELTGGTIVDGTYVLTMGVSYASFAEPSQRATLRISGDSLEWAWQKSAGTIARTNYRFVVKGNTLDMTLTCGDSASGTLSFQATPTTLVLAFGADSQTYEKR